MSSQKEIVAIIGPNGSGKTSAANAIDITSRLPFINPDDIARKEFSHIADENERNLRAWHTCNAIRDFAIADGISFGFETVGSHPSKVDFLRSAKELGYKITVLFVGTECPDINVRRVQQRVKLGGHSVPEEKIRARYYRTMNLLSDYFEVADIATIWDNSIDVDDNNPNPIREVLVHKSSDTACAFRSDTDVKWIHTYLIDNF